MKRPRANSPTSVGGYPIVLASIVMLLVGVVLLLCDGVGEPPGASKVLLGDKSGSVAQTVPGDSESLGPSRQAVLLPQSDQVSAREAALRVVDHERAQPIVGAVIRVYDIIGAEPGSLLQTVVTDLDGGGAVAPRSGGRALMLHVSARGFCDLRQTIHLLPGELELRLRAGATLHVANSPLLLRAMEKVGDLTLSVRVAAGGSSDESLSATLRGFQAGVGGSTQLFGIVPYGVARCRLFSRGLEVASFELIVNEPLLTLDLDRYLLGVEGLRVLHLVFRDTQSRPIERVLVRIDGGSAVGTTAGQLSVCLSPKSEVVSVSSVGWKAQTLRVGDFTGVSEHVVVLQRAASDNLSIRRVRGLPGGSGDTLYAYASSRPVSLARPPRDVKPVSFVGDVAQVAREPGTCWLVIYAQSTEACLSDHLILRVPPSQAEIGVDLHEFSESGVVAVRCDAWRFAFQNVTGASEAYIAVPQGFTVESLRESEVLIQVIDSGGVCSAPMQMRAQANGAVKVVIQFDQGRQAHVTPVSPLGCYWCSILGHEYYLTLDGRPLTVRLPTHASSAELPLNRVFERLEVFGEDWGDSRIVHILRLRNTRSMPAANQYGRLYARGVADGMPLHCYYGHKTAGVGLARDLDRLTRSRVDAKQGSLNGPRVRVRCCEPPTSVGGVDVGEFSLQVGEEFWAVPGTPAWILLPAGDMLVVNPFHIEI